MRREMEGERVARAEAVGVACVAEAGGGWVVCSGGEEEWKVEVEVEMGPALGSSDHRSWGPLARQR